MFCCVSPQLLITRRNAEGVRLYLDEDSQAWTAVPESWSNDLEPVNEKFDPEVSELIWIFRMRGLATNMHLYHQYQLSIPFF